MHNEYGTAYPRYMVWENVLGAFSSNNGEDFRTVLEETAKIIEPYAFIPRPSKKWSKSGCIMGDGWSVAWRVFDAQFWGVPQRRKRIALVADFRGGSAPEILFVGKSLQRDIGTEQTARKNASEGVGGTADNPVWCLQGNGIDRADTAGCNGRGWREDVSYTFLYECHNRDCRYNGPLDTVPTITRHYGTGGNNIPLVASFKSSDDTSTCDLVLKDGIVRRLTPLECERLQGFPDGWTDIGEWTDSKGKKRKCSDSARYRALGNTIALPPWKWVLKRISAQYERDATLGSLFDGIGGFPYLWEQLNGKGSAVWASEIEEFCMAVTEKRID